MNGHRDALAPFTVSKSVDERSFFLHWLLKTPSGQIYSKVLYRDIINRRP